ncbi:hypothetical protein V1477_000009 [Vespula maculifrons]|uniref:Uncharacterized protein n=1 Tax=Vespula maculifrons TaxID=7453 RepID=A0ABD2D3M6_VESMC
MYKVKGPILYLRLTRAQINQLASKSKDGYINIRSCDLFWKMFPVLLSTKEKIVYKCGNEIFLVYSFKCLFVLLLIDKLTTVSYKIHKVVLYFATFEIHQAMSRSS